jgi:DNA repair protein SbcC/Rad50
MKIILKKLSLTNFKGIRSFKVDFSEKETAILGENATGKTSLKDAFLWLFFGKDSSDRKDFEIKTLDENNQPFHRLSHEVEALVDVDGEQLVIKRTMTEKWPKKKGGQEMIFSGHETAFHWNDVPLKEGEFQAKVASVFNENIFKLITNTDYFNSLKWQDRRAVLMQIAGNITNDEVLDSIINVGNKHSFNALIAAFNQKKSVEDFKKEIVAKKKKIKDELDLLPAHIDEANRSLPEAKDYKEIEILINDANTNLENVDSILQNKTVAQKQHQETVLGKVKEMGELRQKAEEIKFAQRNAVADSKRQREQLIADKKRELRTSQDNKARLLIEYNSEDKRRTGLQLIKDELSGKWVDINKEQLVFDDKEFACPACKRAYETDDIEAKKVELTNNFNADKSRRLGDITKRGFDLAGEIKVIVTNMGNVKEKGTLLKAEIELLESAINTLEEENTRLSANETSEVSEAIAANATYIAITQMIGVLTADINTEAPEDNNTELLSRKREILQDLDTLKKELSSKEQRDRILARIKELKDQESTLAQELATLEGTEFSIEQFIRAKMDQVEARINVRFKIVKFKMYEEQINGGQVEACTTLINGVPYSDANNAAKIQSGLDIINTLSDHYDCHGPVWVDNRESVIKLPETKSQLINLIVSEKHKKLTVGENGVEKMAMA